MHVVKQASSAADRKSIWFQLIDEVVIACVTNSMQHDMQAGQSKKYCMCMFVCNSKDIPYATANSSWRRLLIVMTGLLVKSVPLLTATSTSSSRNGWFLTALM